MILEGFRRVLEGLKRCEWRFLGWFWMLLKLDTFSNVF